MIRTTKSCLAIICLSFFMSCGGDTTSTESQATETEAATTENTKIAIAAFVKDFETAYNNEDATTLMNMFTADATRMNTDSTTATGKVAIGKAYEDVFAGADPKVSINNETAERQADGSVHATGTFHVTGKNNAGEQLDIKGNYDMIDVEEDGKWKISKQTLSRQ